MPIKNKKNAIRKKIAPGNLSKAGVKYLKNFEQQIERFDVSITVYYNLPKLGKFIDKEIADVLSPFNCNWMVSGTELCGEKAGTRDVQFDCKDRETADRCAEALKTIPDIDRVEISTNRIFWRYHPVTGKRE
jgi:hypothetical protein